VTPKKKARRKPGAPKPRARMPKPAAPPRPIRRFVVVDLQRKPIVDRSGPNKRWGTLRRIARLLGAQNGIKLDDLSCMDCCAWRRCEFAFDGYNTHGDCLAEK